MQINLDIYVRNFRIFYQQLIKGHPKQQHLSKQFKHLIENELKKWRKGYGISKISETSSDNPLLNKIRQNRKNKEQTKFNVEAYYSSDKVQNCVVFGYLYLVFEFKNVAAFQFLQDQLKAPLTDKQAYTPQILRKMNFVWTKFDDIIYGKRKVVRFDKQLQEYFKQLPQVFLDIIYKIILQEKVMIVENKAIYFEELSEFLSLKIEYFQINQQQSIKTSIYGATQKYSIKIGYIKNQNRYVNVAKIPEKQQKQLNKEITLERFEQMSKQLNQMYAMNMKEYLNLSNIKNRIESTGLIESNVLNTSRSRRDAALQNTSQFAAI